MNTISTGGILAIVEGLSVEKCGEKSMHFVAGYLAAALSTVLNDPAQLERLKSDFSWRSNSPTDGAQSEHERTNHKN
jgi:hypothetical protein